MSSLKHVLGKGICTPTHCPPFSSTQPRQIGMPTAMRSSMFIQAFYTIRGHLSSVIFVRFCLTNQGIFDTIDSMKVKVVLVLKATFDHYIGRKWAEFSESDYGNPYHVHKHGEDAILLYAVWWYAPEQKWLREKALSEICPGDSIGCWCRPKNCHGDIIAGYLNWKRQPAMLF
jgi:hypothetical protein